MESKRPGNRVVVIGGGVIGCACAHFLAERGQQVTLIERDRVGAACSHGNCGFVSPSHVLPLAEPGVVGKALKSMLQRNAPFYIKPRFDPALWSWLWHFARRCNPHDMIESGGAIHALLESSRQLYDQLVRGVPLECEWQPLGLLFVYRSPTAFEAFAEMDRLITTNFQVAARRLDSQQLLEFEPALKPGLAGAWYYEHDAHLRPDKLMASWHAALQQRGVTIRQQCELQRFVEQQGRAPTIETSQGALEAEQFVLAAGALSPRFAKPLGCPLPIQPGKGYSITTPRPARCPHRPMIFAERKVAVTPMKSGYRLGSTMEFAGYDDTLNTRRLEMLTAAAREYLLDPYREPFEERWFGWRPMTYDSVPIIDRSPRLENVWIAAGHNMLGLSMAPGTGRLVAELATGSTPHLDPRPYRVARFGT